MQLIIILEQTSIDPLTITFVMRATVPAGRQSYFADPNKVSAYKQATVEDIAALRAGQILERMGSDVVTGRTVASIKARLQELQAAFQTEITAWNPWKYYGSSWDGTNWTTGGAA